MTANAALRPTPNQPPRLAVTSAEEVLRRLEVTVARRLDGILQGDHRGLIPGHGSELGDAREYQPGDDVRRMDWSVTARMPTPHVRDAIADRELETWVLVDASPSLRVGTAACEKRDLAMAAVAAVGFLTARGGNRIGALVAGASPKGDRPDRITPARSGRAHLWALLRVALDAYVGPTSEPIELATSLRRLDATMRRRGLAVVVSDFLDPGDWRAPLGALATRHDVLAVEVIDPRELALPDVGLLELEDPETGARLEVQTADPALRARYAEAAAAQRAEVARRIRGVGADHLVLRTDQDWLVDLVSFVVGRRERLATLGRSR